MKTRAERNKIVVFYLSDKEKDRLVRAAKRRDMTISDYCRSAIILYDAVLNSGKDVEDER